MVACVYTVMSRRAGQFLGEGGNRDKSTQVTRSEANRVSVCINRKTIPENLSFDLHIIPPWSALPSQNVVPSCMLFPTPRAALPPNLDSHEVSGAPCASLAARPGTRCPGQPSPWRSRSRRCGPQAGRGNSASPDAWGGEKSVYLQDRFKTFSFIIRDSLFLFIKPLHLL